MIFSALNCAVKQRLIPGNPTKGCVLPKLKRKEMKILPPESLGTFFEETRYSGVFELYYVDLTTPISRMGHGLGPTGAAKSNHQKKYRGINKTAEIL